MKKVLYLAVACGLLLTGCNQKAEKFAYDEEYFFSKVTFTYAKEMSIEDLAHCIPAGVQISSLKELEEYIADNLDAYSCVTLVDGGQRTVYAKNDLESITFLEENNLAYAFDGNKTYKITANPRNDEEGISFNVGINGNFQVFYYNDGYVYYQKALTDNFIINYVFDNE